MGDVVNILVVGGLIFIVCVVVGVIVYRGLVGIDGYCKVVVDGYLLYILVKCVW